MEIALGVRRCSLPPQLLLLRRLRNALGSFPVRDVLTEAEELRKFRTIGAGIERRAHRFDNLREDLQSLARTRGLLDKRLRHIPRFMQSEHGQKMKEDLPPRLINVFCVDLPRGEAVAKLFCEALAILSRPRAQSLEALRHVRRGIGVRNL